MGYIENSIDLQYAGYANTNLLWKTNQVFGLKQFEIQHFKTPELLETIGEKMRLGYRVERFVGSDLRRMKEVELLAENIQIQENKQTIGELDCLLLHKGKPIHLEIGYKLYLYDPTVGTSEIDHWIGGNRRDSFAKKIEKVKEKQLPLLYNRNTKKVLDRLGLQVDDFEQQVHFRAQLYVPFQQKVNFTLLNPDCLTGFYIKPAQLKRFSKFQFFVPNKRDWLVDPQFEADWIDFKAFEAYIQRVTQHHSYPLCWIKYPDNRMEKFFVVWWE